MELQATTAAFLDRVAVIARQAGAAINEIYQRGKTQISYKEDSSPLTEADLASHEVIMEGLKSLAPEIPILSEEGVDQPFEERKDRRQFWLVDPLDGTKEFIKRNGEFTVNIALVQDGVPVLGVVHAPVLERTFVGGQGLGAWQFEGDGESRSIRVSPLEGGPLRVVASRSHSGPELSKFLENFPEHVLVSMGSSLKLCLVATGEADIYPRLGPTMEWDTGAAHGVVLAAGGQVVDLKGKPLRYNKENLLNPFFMVLGGRPVAWQDALS